MTSLLAAMAGLSGVTQPGLFYSITASASRLAYLFVECVRQVSLILTPARVCAAGTHSTVTA